MLKGWVPNPIFFSAFEILFCLILTGGKRNIFSSAVFTQNTPNTVVKFTLYLLAWVAPITVGNLVVHFSHSIIVLPNDLFVQSGLGTKLTLICRFP